MSDIIPLPFKPYPVPRNEYEEFWNSEHFFVFEMFFTAPRKDRTQIVQSRWQLKQRVMKTLADKRCTNPAFLTEVRQAVSVSQQEAACLRKAKQCVLVDNLLRDCPLAKAKRMRVRPLPVPMPDVHWSNQCADLLQQIDSKFSAEVTDTPESPRTPRHMRTIKDFFT